MDGFLCVLKPPGMTSSDVVFFVRKLLPRGVKVGHGGTLDPEAAGVLPICVGRAARLFDYIIDKDKEYIAELWIGVKTDTQDATGKVLAASDAILTAEDVKAVLPEFTGKILQTPPMYSAIKLDGKRLYERARKGEEVAVQPREVFVREIEYLSQTGARAHRLRVLCGKGVYIRTLLNDIGQRLGTFGTMSFLLRSRAGVFSLENGHTLDELRRCADLRELLLPMDAPLAQYRAVRVPEAQRRVAQNGGALALDAARPGEIVRIYCAEDFYGVGECIENGRVKFRAMLAAEV
jgi:tRNA pseudouridine55 synthase